VDRRYAVVAVHRFVRSWRLSVTHGLTCLACGGTLGETNQFDGVYTGQRVPTKCTPRACQPTEAVTVTIRGAH
jgi:hypothetical protein